MSLDPVGVPFSRLPGPVPCQLFISPLVLLSQVHNPKSSQTQSLPVSVWYCQVFTVSTSLILRLATNSQPPLSGLQSSLKPNWGWKTRPGVGPRLWGSLPAAGIIVVCLFSAPEFCSRQSLVLTWPHSSVSPSSTLTRRRHGSSSGGRPPASSTSQRMMFLQVITKLKVFCSWQ